MAPAQDRSTTGTGLELSEPTTVRDSPPCPTDPPLLLQSSPTAHRGTSPGWSPRGAVGPQVTSMAQRMQLASVTLHSGWLLPSEQGRRAERLHQAIRLLLCSAPAPQGSLSLLPSSHGWQESVSLSVHPSLLVSPELSGEGHDVQTPLQLWWWSWGQGTPAVTRAEVQPCVHCPAQGAPAQAAQACPCSVGTATMGLGTGQTS